MEQPSQRGEASRGEEEREEMSGREGSKTQTYTNQIGMRMGAPRRHPFVDGIMDVELLVHWKGLTIS